MSSENIKDQIISFIKTLPDDITLEDIMYHIYAQQKILKGLKEADEGKTVSIGEVGRAANLARATVQLIMKDKNAFGRLFEAFNHDFFTADTRCPSSLKRTYFDIRHITDVYRYAIKLFEDNIVYILNRLNPSHTSDYVLLRPV